VRSARTPAAQRPVQLLEGLEELVPVLFGYPRAGVGHAYHDVVSLLPGLHPHAAVFRESTGVAHQVEQHLADPRPVAEHQRKILLRLGLQEEVLRPERRPHGNGRGLDHLRQGYALLAERTLAGLDLAQVEDIVDQARKVLTVA
jgi:hypothetical protein